MLEKAARALHERRTMWPWDEAGEEQRNVSIGDVRAVLMAVREPGPHECIKGGIAIGDSAALAQSYADYADAAFTAMIDAILEGK